MAPEQLAEAERLLRSGADLDAVCAAVGVERRTLEREWPKTYGTTPGRWRREQGLGPEPAGVSPVRAFRLDDPRLDKAAREDGVSPGEWARNAVLRALDRRGRKK